MYYISAFPALLAFSALFALFFPTLVPFPL